MGGLSSRGLPARAAIAVNTSGDSTLVNGVAGKRIIVVSFVAVNAVATAQSVRFKSGASSNLTGVMALPSEIGGHLDPSDPENGLFETAKGDNLVVNLSAATAVGGFLSYVLLG